MRSAENRIDIVTRIEPVEVGICVVELNSDRRKSFKAPTLEVNQERIVFVGPGGIVGVGKPDERLRAELPPQRTKLPLEFP